jgi:hypothetical protein
MVNLIVPVSRSGESCVLYVKMLCEEIRNVKGSVTRELTDKKKSLNLISFVLRMCQHGHV